MVVLFWYPNSFHNFKIFNKINVNSIKTCPISFTQLLNKAMHNKEPVTDKKCNLIVYLRLHIKQHKFLILIYQRLLSALSLAQLRCPLLW